MWNNNWEKWNILIHKEIFIELVVFNIFAQ